MPDTESYTFRMSPEKKKELFLAASETGMNSASIVRNLLFEYLDKRKQQKAA